MTNELAVLSPYEVSFRCFSSELAAVLAGFAGSPCGLMVKTINVESAPASAPVSEEPGTPVAGPAVIILPRHRQGPRSGPSPRRSSLPALWPERPRRRTPTASSASVRSAAGGAAPAAAACRLALDEKQLKVTLMLEVVKLVPPSKMDFLKKHYEKVLLGVVLLGLAVAVAFLPFKIASEKQTLEDMRNQLIHPKVKPLTNLDLDPAGQRAQAGGGARPG